MRDTTLVAKPDFTAKQTLLEILKEGEGFLADNGVPHARLNMERLVSHILHKSRLEMYLNKDEDLPEHERKALSDIVIQRAQHIPLQYLIKKTEFFYLLFNTDKRALIPRPETELLVELVLSTAKVMYQHTFSIVDVGTGSGCIAVALAVNLQRAKIIAIDISPEALSLAKENALLHNVTKRIQFIEGNLVAPLVEKAKKCDILVANIPYVSEQEIAQLPAEVKTYEPLIALNGGADGLTYYRKMIPDIHAVVNAGGFFFFEIGDNQSGQVLALMKQNPHIAYAHCKKDLNNIDRIIYGQVGQ